MQKCSKKQQTKKTEQKMVLYLDNVTSPSLLYFAFSLTPQLILPSVQIPHTTMLHVPHLNIPWLHHSREIQSNTSLSCSYR